MKVSKLVLGFTIALLGAPAAFAAFVEGTADLEALRTQRFAPAPETARAVGGSFDGSMWEDLRGQQQASVQEGAKSTAGFIAEVKGVNARRADESIYEAIRRNFH